MRGFTLVEVLIAIFLITVGIVGVLSVFPLGSQTVKSAQMASQAVNLAGAKMEELISKSYSDPALSPATTTEDYATIADFAFHKRVTRVSCVHRSNLSEVSCSYDQLVDPYPMKKVEVTVFWKQLSAITEKKVKAVSLISKR